MAIRKAPHRAGFASAAGCVGLLSFPAMLIAPKEQPTAIVQGLGVLNGFKPAGEYIRSDAHQTSGPVAPKRTGAVVSVFIGIYIVFGFYDWLGRRVRDGGQYKLLSADHA